MVDEEGVGGASAIFDADCAHCLGGHLDLFFFFFLDLDVEVSNMIIGLEG